MASEEKQEQKLDLFILLGDFVKIAKRHILLCLVLVIGLSGFFGFRAYRSYAPIYTASATFSVRVTDPVYGGISAYNTATAEQMAKTFPYVLTSGVLQERVKAHLGAAYMPVVQVVPSASGSVISIEVIDPDPQFAWEVLNAVIVYYPEIAEYVVGPTRLVLLDESGVPTAPSNSLSLKGPVMKGALMGLGLWAAIVLVLAMMVNTVHNEKELQTLVNIPCVGQIPYVRRSARRSSSMLLSLQRSSYAESLRTLRVRTEKAMEKMGKNVLLVSSAIPGEGKTTISASLALSWANKGKKVLLIDCDLRNPAVVKTLGVQTEALLDEYLEGRLEMEEAVSATDYERLYITAGKAGKSANMKTARMRRMEAMIRAARQQYDIIILDTPPSSLLADASEVANMADCGLMVVRQGYASREQILDGIQRLDDANLPLIGCVMTHVRGRDVSGYSYGYGYSYGEKQVS